ncbi:hypothetical protein [Streptomyces prunicolor]|uniref:hypothetical protein n=1 Tax=Streptomyces prunicolor TaxID=67348 RepID=UPI0033EF9F86
MRPIVPADLLALTIAVGGRRAGGHARLIMPLQIRLSTPPRWSTGSARASRASPRAPANPLALGVAPT